jgi:hypothetical protein
LSGVAAKSGSGGPAFRLRLNTAYFSERATFLSFFVLWEVVGKKLGEWLNSDHFLGGG